MSGYCSLLQSLSYGRVQRLMDPARAQCEREGRARSVVASESVGLSQLYSTRDHLVSEGLWELGGGERSSTRAGSRKGVDCK